MKTEIFDFKSNGWAVYNKERELEYNFYNNPNRISFIDFRRNNVCFNIRINKTTGNWDNFNKICC